MLVRPLRSPATIQRLHVHAPISHRWLGHRAFCQSLSADWMCCGKPNRWSSRLNKKLSCRQETARRAKRQLKFCQLCHDLTQNRIRKTLAIGYVTTNQPLKQPTQLMEVHTLRLYGSFFQNTCTKLSICYEKVSSARLYEYDAISMTVVTM